MGLNYARGVDAIKEEDAPKNRFRSFSPSIKWSDGDEKYLLFLNTLDEVPKILLHEWVVCGETESGKPDYGFFMSRLDPAIGEDNDPLTDKGSDAKRRHLIVAVELEADLAQNAKGKTRPKGFRVATSEYERKTDDGTETVVTPNIGVITQAKGNFFNILVSEQETNGEITETAYRVKRVGGDQDTVYSFTPFFDQPVDLSGLVENIEGVSYLSRNEEVWSELQEALDDVDTDEEKAHAIAVALLEARLTELSDYDLYKDRTSHIEEIKSKYGSRKDKDTKSEKKSSTRAPKNRENQEERFAELLALAGGNKSDDE